MSVQEYQLRLTAGFHRHLELCRQFYATGGTGDWWRAELAALDSGLGSWPASRLAERRGRYLLDGFELRRMDGARQAR